MVDTKKVIKCPACEEMMAKFYVSEQNFDLDFCIDGCGGIFFDNRELTKFDKPDENADLLFDILKGKFYTKVDKAQLRICPACGTPMVKMGAGVSEVVIDVCNVCGAKFLDNGELEKIRGEESLNISDIIGIMLN